ncbi:hypothetical protein OG21DRAFT_1367173, partial [Imleria badia]
ASDTVSALFFSQSCYWLRAATAIRVKVIDLESKYLKPEFVDVGANSQEPE